MKNIDQVTMLYETPVEVPTGLRLLQDGDVLQPFADGTWGLLGKGQSLGLPRWLILKLLREGLATWREVIL